MFINLIPIPAPCPTSHRNFHFLTPRTISVLKMYSIPILPAFISTIFITNTIAYGALGTTNNPNCGTGTIEPGNWDYGEKCSGPGWGGWYTCPGDTQVSKYLPVLPSISFSFASFHYPGPIFFPTPIIILSFLCAFLVF